MAAGLQGTVEEFRSMPRVYYELLVVGLALMLGMSLPASFLPILAKDLDPSGLLVGLVVSAWFFSRIFMELPAGIISDRIGRRRLFILGLALSTVGPLVCVFANNIWILILARGVWGMGTAFYFMNNMAMLTDVLPSKVRGRALGIFQGVEIIGSFVGAPIGAFLTGFMSYNQVFLFTFAFTVVSLVMSIRSGAIKGVEQTGKRETISIRAAVGGLRDGGILTVCSSNMLRMLVMQGIFQTVFQLYLNNTLGFSVAAIGWVVSARLIGQSVSLVAMGSLSDRVGRKPVLLAGFGVTAVSLFGMTLTDSFPMMLLLGALSGFGEGSTVMTLIALLTDITPHSIRGGAIGMYRTFMDIGGFVGPVAFMMLYNGADPRVAFYAAVGVSLLNVVWLALFKPKASKEE